MTNRPSSPRKAFTLIETLLTLITLMFISGMAAILWAQQRDVQTARALSYRQAELLNAAQNYISANSATLITDTVGGPVAIPAGQLTAGGAQPVGSTGLMSLQSGGFINSQFVDVNMYNQNTWLVVKAGATANSLEGIVFSTGGEVIPDNILGTAMQFLGADGGYIPSKPLAGQVGMIVGSKGGWIASIANFIVPGFATPTAGHLAAWIANTPNAGVTGDFLWRTNMGVPEGNRMHTDINVGQHELDHVSQITGGPTTTPDAGSSTQTAINLASTLVPGTTPLADASLGAAPGEYENGAGATYPYYSRVDGNSRFKRLDPSTIIDTQSWDAQGGAMPRNYPTGTRLIDALPPVVVQASYVATDNTLVPIPTCGNPSNPDPTKARIFATPLSSFDYVAPEATTTNVLNYTSVPVINTATLTQAGSAVTLNTTTENINNVQSITATTIVDPSGISTRIYAKINSPTTWLFHATRSSGPYITDPADPRYAINNPAVPPGMLQPENPGGTYGTNYPSDYLIQTACYYGN